MSNISLIKSPVVTEKAAIEKENNVYVFRVEPLATKTELKKGIEDFFKVKVASIRVLVQKGKTKKFGSAVGRTAAFKKAYVKLASGKIELFESL